MNWYSIGLAAGSGALAALIASLIFGKKPEKKTAFTIVVVILFVVFNTLSKELILPELNAFKAKSDIQQAFSDIPAFQSIKNHEPDTYARLVASLTEVGKKGYSEQQAIDIVRGQISSLVAKRLPKASDEAIISYIGVLIDEMTELQSQGGDLCFRLLFPQAGGGVDGRKVFSKEIQKRDLEALDLTIKSYDANRQIPSETQVMPYLEPIYLKLFEVYGNDVLALENPAANNVDKGKVCSITKTLYSEILKLDPEKSVGALRWMLSQS